MIAWLKGKVLHIEGNSVVLDVNGVGYLIHLGSNTFIELSVHPNAGLELPIYTSVKEDDIQLFGFSSFLAKRLFLLLLKVNGVGPKSALLIVDQLGEKQIYASIEQGDARSFLSVSGIGKKTAQRIILDLQDKINSIDLTDVLQITKQGESEKVVNFTNIMQDAKSALVNLGFVEKEVKLAIQKHHSQDTSLDDLIRKSLADLSKKLTNQ